MLVFKLIFQHYSILTQIHVWDAIRNSGLAAFSYSSFGKSVFIRICPLAKIFRKNCWWVIFSPLPTPKVSKSQHQNLTQNWANATTFDSFWQLILNNIKQVTKNQRESIPLASLSTAGRGWQVFSSMSSFWTLLSPGGPM
jgi:hypothetical protein